MNKIKRHCALSGMAILLLGVLSGFPAVAEPNFGSTGQPTTGTAGSRGRCPNMPANTKPLTLLVPAQANLGGKTTADHPTFWVYVPSALISNPLQFELQTEAGQEVYKTQIPANQLSPGIISIALPTTAPALELDKVYRLFISIDCVGNSADVPASVEGLVQRVAIAPTLQSQLNPAKPDERSQIYANNLLWYDALTVLAEGLRSNPEDAKLRTAWTQLLQLPSVKLGSFTTESVSPCCTAASSNPGDRP